MSTHKHFDKICLVAAVLALILCVAFMGGEAFGIQAADKVMGYEERLFDTSKVHTIDIIIDDWDGFLETAQSEEYSVCSVVIDGEAIPNVGIRGKGNTSLSSVATMNSDRYSFKIEFDQYDSSKTYHGLDKLSLNNLIQDNTYMKDYLTYQMMNEFGAAAPLCSYVYVTVNGEDWGLYLAVEAVEDSFLQRNYGSDYGELYKPDSMNMGGGRGNGKDFDMNDFADQWAGSDTATERPESDSSQTGRPNRGDMTMPGSTTGGTTGGNGMPWGDMPSDGQFPMDEDALQNFFQGSNGNGGMQMPDMGNFGGFGGFGMGSSDVKLQYIDDDPDSYSTIFGSAKTDVTKADKTRLIESLKQLSSYENLDEVVNVDAVLRYFVVHNYVVNGDSYTGSMIHNYYLYEENGQLSMIPWDYNLAFGTFMGGSGSSSVNDDIDEVLSDRPMQAWIFSDQTYTEQYYALYAQLLEQVDIQGIIDNAYALIAPYVEKDPTAFCSYEEFQTGVETLKAFCTLRSESVALQLSGSTETVDASALDLSAMGTMGGGMGGGFNGMDFGGRGDSGTGSSGDTDSQQGGTQFPDGSQFPGGQMPDGTQFPDGSQFPGGQMPDGMQMPEGMPEGMQPPDGAQMPDGMQFPGGAGMMGNGSVSGGENQGTTGEMPDFGSMGNFGGMGSSGQKAGTIPSAVIWLAVSVLILAVGLVVAFKFKR